VDHKTIRRYVEAAIAAGFVPGGTPPMSQADWAPLVKQWFPHLTDTRLRQVTWPDFDKHHDCIVEMLRAGVTKATIHQRLRDEHGVAGSLASFKRYITANLAEDAARDKVTVLRADPEPDLEGQIDYGLLGSWMDPRTGRAQRIWAFVMVLSHSRHMFVRPVISMDQASWTASHVEAFAFFGGCPARTVRSPQLMAWSGALGRAQEEVMRRRSGQCHDNEQAGGDDEAGVGDAGSLQQPLHTGGDDQQCEFGADDPAKGQLRHSRGARPVPALTQATAQDHQQHHQHCKVTPDVRDQRLVATSEPNAAQYQAHRDVDQPDDTGRVAAGSGRRRALLVGRQALVVVFEQHDLLLMHVGLH
jgi:hypothetical protein